MKLKTTNSSAITIHHNKIDKYNNVKLECLKENTIKRLQKNCHHKAIKLLEKLYPEKVKLYDYSEFQIIETGSHYKYPIHDDTPNKLLSGVIYIKPKENSGTIFYETRKGDGKKIVDWKPNRAVFFARKERETWHSYEGNKVSNRIALVYNLMTERVKEVYKIEGKNYFFGQLRYSINPYLHRYFKILI